MELKVKMGVLDFQPRESACETILMQEAAGTFKEPEEYQLECEEILFKMRLEM